MSLLGQLEKRGVKLTPKLAFDSAEPIDAETLNLLKNHKDELLRSLITPDALSPLPWELRRLLAAASSDFLPNEAVMLPDGLVTDLNRYAQAWGCSYLIGNQDEALRRLWQVYEVWQEVSRARA